MVCFLHRCAHSICIEKNAGDERQHNQQQQQQQQLIHKLFQKYKTLVGEIEANTSRYEDLVARARNENNDDDDQETTNDASLRSFEAKWSSMERQVALRRDEFATHKQAIEFHELVDSLEPLLVDIESAYSLDDDHSADANSLIGIDYEHCQRLGRQLDERCSALGLGETRLASLLALADRLSHSAPAHGATALATKLAERWQRARLTVGAERARFERSLAVHRLARDLADVEERLEAKRAVVIATTTSCTSTSTSTSSVQLEQTRLVDMERDVAAIETRIEQLRCCPEAEHAANTTTTRAMQSRIETALSELRRLMSERSARLRVEHEALLFAAEHGELSRWLASASATLLLDERRRVDESTSEAEAALNAHAALGTQMAGKAHRFRALEQRMRSDAPSQTQMIGELLVAERRMADEWQRKHEWLVNSVALAELREAASDLASKCERLVGDELALLVPSASSSEETAESAASVERQLAKLDTLAAHVVGGQLASAFDTFKRRVDEWLASGRAAGEQESQRRHAIQALAAEMAARQDELHALVEKRRLALNDALAYSRFLAAFYSAVQWVREKTVSALDASAYTGDLSNMATKQQRHAAFVDEIERVGSARVRAVNEQAQAVRELLAQRHTDDDYDRDEKLK